jgi:hypothetical protein
LTRRIPRGNNQLDGKELWDHSVEVQKEVWGSKLQVQTEGEKDGRTSWMDGWKNLSIKSYPAAIFLSFPPTHQSS